MIARKSIVTLTASLLLVLPAMAQTTKDAEKNGHHYSGGPNTVVPHHMGKKKTDKGSPTAKSGGHHYSGGPNSSAPHHMGEKQ
jgi:hypothetical protein